MFLPLGDDVDTRTLPFVGLALVGINVLVFCAMVGMAVDYAPPKSKTALRASKTPKARKAPKASKVENASKPHGGFVAAIEGFDRAPQTREVIVRYGLAPKDLDDSRFLGTFTHMFIHGGLVHLLGNMMVLWAFVVTLEHTLGAWRFLVCYLLWGIVAGLTHAAMHWGSNVPLVGASGAIAGVIGAYWVAYGARTRIRTLVCLFPPRTWMIPSGVFVAIWLFSQLVGITDSSGDGGGVAWYAHLGGFAAGAGTMLLMRGRTARRLVQFRDGSAEFKEVVAPSDQDTTADDSPLTARCPYCHTEVSVETSLASNLSRCPNTSCGRLVLLEPPLAVSAR